MSTLEESFGTLLGRQPTDKECQDLYRVRDALHLKDNDALWLLLMALGHYERLYSRLPEQIREVAGSTLADVKEAAAAQIRASVEATKRDLTEAMARTAQEIAREAGKAAVLRWTAILVGSTLVGFLMAGWWLHDRGSSGGYARGWAAGYRQGADEKAAASWANTPEGQLAYGLAKAGSIRELAGCLGRGWVQKAGVCHPRPERGISYGWRVARPEEGGR